MNKIIRSGLAIAAFLTVFSISGFSQKVKRTPFDVTNYVMNVSLVPAERRISATVDVAFTPLEDTRGVEFEMNGSLKIDSITRVDRTGSVSPAAKTSGRATVSAATGSVTFVQDQTGVSDLGPSVRIDLGDTVVKGTPMVLRFKYSGILDSAQGGPLQTKRLAHIGDSQGYLMYAARWFPFHDYAADRATADISISLPSGLQLVGYSDSPVTSIGGKYRFVQAKPGLIGNFAYGKYFSKTLRFGEYELQFNSRVSNDALIASYGETLGKAFDNYTKRFGAPEAGKRLIIAQIDDESLEYYSSLGMLFIGSRQFEEARDITTERLQREAAYQWWGLTVGLKSFDDAWLSQGLAEYSAFSLRESGMDNSKLDAMRRELLEKALTFEQTASLLRAPAIGCAGARTESWSSSVGLMSR